MNNEKLILDILTKMQAQQEQMQTQLNRIETRLDRMEARQDRMEARLDQMEARLDRMEARQDRMEARLDQMEARLDRMEARQDRMEARQDQMEALQNKALEDMHLIKAYLELDVETRLKAINEGIDVILDRLIPEERIGKAEDDIIVLKTAVRALARDVAELKKAQ